jgi:hypothetical protein
MNIIKTFENFKEDSNIIELDYDIDNMIKCQNLLNLIPRNGNFNKQLIELSDVIKNTLNEKTFNKIFGDTHYEIWDILIFFMTHPQKDDLLRMFNKVVIQEGADGEDEWVATLKIDDRIVLLLASSQRGGSIRIEGDDYLTLSEIKIILERLCHFYNENF